MARVTSAALHTQDGTTRGKEQTMKSKAGVAERPSYQPALLFIIGLGLNSSWWLCLSANPNVWIFSNSNVSWAATAVMHLAYLATHLACVVLALPLSAQLRQRPFPLTLGVITAFSALAIGTLSAAQLPIPLYLACLIAGSITNAVLFLGWMALFAEALCLSLQLPAIVASMAFSSALWLITTSLPGWAMLAMCAVMPIVSAGFFCALRSYSDDSNLGKTAANTSDASERAGSVFKLLTPTFLIGIAAYELVPGFVTSIAHVNNTSGLYAFYAMEMSVVAVLCFAFGRKPGFLRVINRFVLPLLSVGLIALGLFSANQVDIALAASLSGSMLFEAFLFCRLAQLARLHRAEPLHLFAVGGAAMQAGLCISYLLVPVLSSPAQITVACVALLLVVLFVVGEPFFTRQEATQPNGLGSNTAYTAGDCGETEEDSRPAAVSATKMFQETCAAYAASIGLSARESDVLVLAMQGKNISVLADELSIAPSTVKTHLRSIYHKAGVSDRQELIMRFQEFQN